MSKIFPIENSNLDYKEYISRNYAPENIGISKHWKALFSNGVKLLQYTDVLLTDGIPNDRFKNEINDKDLPNDATSLNIRILDQKGNVVLEKEGLIEKDASENSSTLKKSELFKCPSNFLFHFSSFISETLMLFISIIIFPPLI